MDTFTTTFKAGASIYGIGDVEALAKDTHKFEAHYLDNLIGKYPHYTRIISCVRVSPVSTLLTGCFHACFIN